MLFTWFMLTGLIFLFTPQTLTSKFQLAFVHVFRWPLSIGADLALTAQTRQTLTDAPGRSISIILPALKKRWISNAGSSQSCINYIIRMFGKERILL